MQQLHWTAPGRGLPPASHNAQQPSAQVNSASHFTNRGHLALTGGANAGGGNGGGVPVVVPASGAPVGHANPVGNNVFYASRFANTQATPQSPTSQQPSQQQQQTQQQQQQQRATHPPANAGPSSTTGVGTGHNVAEMNPPLVGREAPAISGANSAAAHTSSTATGVFFSGTRTNFTDIGGAAAYGLGAGGVGSPSGPNANAAGNLMADANDAEVNQLLRELECSVDTPHATAVLRDAVDAIEARALANFDPLSRDTFLEQRIRDVLAELSRTTNEKSLLLAVNFIEALIPIAYTSPQSKFTRLCRSLSVLRQSGNEKAARESQRVYKLLLEADAHFPEPNWPLKSFVPKELRENCEQALLQLHGRVQQAKASFPAQFFSVMLGCAATAEVSPRYLSGTARAQAIQLGMTLAGSPDELLRKAACECMVAIFSNTTSMRPNELVVENRRLCEECFRALNASQHNEGHIVSALKALHALFSRRGLSSIDKQVLPQLCVLVTEQQRMSKSALVRGSVCDLIPIIAPVDIAAAPRRTTYCAIIMEPVKNVRDERFKAHELQNVASFVLSVGYRVFDPTNRTNLESILHRYISRPETQEACWSIMAAICASSVSTAGAGGAVAAVSPITLSRRSIHRSAAMSPSSGRMKTSDSVNMAGAIVSPTTVGASGDLSLSLSNAEADAVSRHRSKDNTTGSSPRMQQQHGFPNGSETNSARVATTRHGGSPSGGKHNDVNEDQGGNGGNGDDHSSVAVVSTTTAVQSPDRSSCLTTPATPSAPVFNFGTTSAHLSLTIDDIVQRCLPYLTHAVLTQPLVDSLRVIQTSRPPLKAEVQAALDKLVDSALMEPAGYALTTIAGVQPSGSSQSYSMHGRDGDGANAALNSGNSAPLGAAPSSRGPQHPLAGSEPSTVAARPGSNGNSIGTMGRLSQYFRPADNAAGTHRREDSSPDLGPSTPLTGGASGSRAGASPSHGPTAAAAAGGGPGGFLSVNSSFAAAGSEHMHEHYGSTAGVRYSPMPSSISAAFSPVGSAPPSQSANITPAAVLAVLKNDLTVALKVFSERPVTSVQHLDDLKSYVIGFQHHDDPQVRKQSSETIISSLRQWIAYAKEHKTSTYSTRVTEILEAYMKNVLLEVDRRCRLYEITLLANATSLRVFLSEQRILSSLLSFLNSTAQVREKTVELLVAVTQDSKPSPSVVAVQQSLYVTVESCVVILEFTNDVNMLLRSMADLQTFTRLCIRPLSNHLGRIFYAFRKRILESTVPDVVLLSLLKTMATILEALSKEEKVVLQYQDDVLELYIPIVDILKHSPSPVLSHAAINVLVHMNEMCLPNSTTDVRQQQELIGSLVNVYTGSSCTVEESLSMLTLFGQLGAVDPALQSSAVTVKKKEEVAIQDEADLELTYDYTVIVYRTLSRMLDASLSDAVCSQALRTLLQFIRSTQDKKDIVGGVHAVRAVLQVIKRVTDSPALRVEALHVLAAITAMRHERIARLMLPEIVVLLEQLWTPTDRPLFRGVLEVVSALKPGKLSGKEQSESWAWLYPRLVDVAFQDHTESREFCLRVVEIVLNASYIPPHCIPIVFPMLMQFIQQSDQLVDVRSQSLCAAVHIVCELKAVQFFSSLLHGIRTLTRHCELNEDLGPRLSTPGVRESLKVLAALHPSGRGTIKQLRDRIGEGEDRLSAAAAAGSPLYTSTGMQAGSMVSFVGANPNTTLLGPLSAHGSNGVSPLAVTSMPNSGGSRSLSALGIGSPTGTGGGGSYLRRTVPETFPGAEEEDVSLSLGADQPSGAATAGQEVSLFMKHVELGFRLKESKLREWFVEFQKSIILVSPHPAFRMMVDLLDKHDPLRRELFLPSFKCLYESLTADQIKKLNEMLTIVLNCSDHELSSKCLGLADYLDHNEPNLKPEVLEVVRSLRRADHHRINHSSEPDSLLVRSTASSNNNVLTVRGRGSASNVNQQPQLYPATAEAPMNHVFSAKIRGRPAAAAAQRGAMRGNSPSIQPTVANPASQSTNKGRGVAGGNQNGDPNRSNPDVYAFGNNGAGNTQAQTVERQIAPSVAAGGDGGEDEGMAVDEESASGSCSPVDTLDDASSEKKIDEGTPANPDLPQVDISGVPGLQAAGSYRPLVCSVARKAVSNQAYTLSHGSGSSSDEFSADSHDPDVQLTGSHIPAQPNMLFSTEDIVRAAEHTRMYDKALSYLENRLLAMLNIYRYTKMPRDVIHKTVWPLAWLYSQREMQDSVVGLFRAIRYEGGEDQAGFGFELLRWWSQAQRTYAKSITTQALRDMTVPPHILEGYVRTLTLCGEWNRAYDISMQVSSRREAYVSSTVARCGATAAWLLGHWEDVQFLAERLSVSERHTTALRLFFLNGVALRNAIAEHSSGAYESLRHMITQSKLVIDESLRTLLPLSYTHAYESVTMLQHFTEMEEMIDFCHCRSAKGRQQMYERWNNRFRYLKPDALQPSLRSLMLHSLVLSTSEMADMILHFCKTRQASYPELTEWAMSWLRHGSFSGCGSRVSTPSVSSPTSVDHAGLTIDVNSAASLATVDSNPNVAVGFIIHLWSRGKRQEAVEAMELFLRECGKDLEENYASCYGSAQLRLGTWKQDQHTDSFWRPGFREEELEHFHKAIRAMPSSYEAWHSWGLMNYRIQQRDHNLSPEDQRTFVEAAHQGFVGAICRCKDSSEALPAVMRLLQLWVIHNGVGLLKETVADSISRIPIDHWVQAIPQLIGHLGNDDHDIREVICMILRSLCEVHPQATVFPLLVVMMSDSNGSGSPLTANDSNLSSFANSSEAAPVNVRGSPRVESPTTMNSKSPMTRKQEIVQSIIQHCPKRIFHEAEAVAKLLVDVSAIPIEKIRENLSQVAAAWNPNAEYEEDPEEIYRRLQNTMEIFHANRRHLLFTVGDIGQFVQMVMVDERSGQREKAAGVVSQLVEEISKHVAEKLGREPQKAMEPLLHLRNLSVAVFGEYDIHNRDNYPTIASFSSKLDVIPSKKRPRRIQLNGSDGCLYTYCLKGNEDIRMDERVMQLFGMVNVLLSHTRIPTSAYIHRFPVIPISSNVGLLGWVENANTINNTICNYRTNISNVRTHQESSALRSYVESFGNWDKLSIIQRTEVLDFVMNSEHCEAVDVSRAMWHRANTAEQWLDRRTAFTVSLATMSMVGYIMGLGDRHLGNILISMSTGKVAHIDFGDSFDVGRLRHVLPETVPFRLTRMLTNAMEVFGVDGVFRAFATRTQTTLHKNRDSIMALLSAFVYDPIVQYKGKMKNVMEKSRSPQDVVERIRNKLRGMEMAVNRSEVNIFNTTQDSCRRPDLLYMSTAFDDPAIRKQTLAMSAEEQVSFLIDEATRIDNYTTLYFGWGPLW
ncbi:putative phosphatidylinositol 3-kinase [Leptomonas pyrrhocoris]|uniref:non-specific serine/threonine protein kinase n=1 Tax=Leptomonas pyrrhocoris TaxID=157538 RepID=A0A0N0VDC4_LEPPY|nr:putative phosphatidylinositol 3-kinase [Leptomonas pyrrhocoris]KPA75271.1 putative phosphatidylinositol 3-kinase [Leptomonas pyrrhocoris]|eukprot:XP_015653710.1 putative phosphatidylinositol 3-kinase [Leptomonas pyrrhocoris]